MEYDQTYYIDAGTNYYDPSRNAGPIVDHRTGTRLQGRPTSIMSTRYPAVASAAPPAYGYGSPPAAYGYAPQAWYPTNPVYVSPNATNASTNLGAILGGLGDIGSLSNIIAQAFAAFMPLPASPTPQDSADSDASVNASVNSSNLIRYQSALAQYAKRDQQILTLGSVLRELFKRPGTVI